ncbi:glycoside hydrolase family 127 protein [Asticcacaulis machinosus]|uniref:Glycoside hydrolase family 127 protein n=1 Tax=Asticcacaulis machinosus TaxID=2984211 RepID=A0ABT5HMM4_9CAUL|nr:glycoside hydrolase family 127 protein [Asticcacaulis machinosus]MDC7677396.1 glycoside hydrolase family 127 protein [Asticcacaulis machinosus]
MPSFALTSRRRLLCGAAGLTALTALPAIAQTASKLLPQKARSLPLSDVRLLASDFKTAVDVNEKYLLTVNADSLLHNYRKGAGLPPKAEIYGGWERDTIAGHSLGHYLSAVSLMYASTGNAEFKTRAIYIIDELALIQGMQGDGYVAGFTRKRKDGSVVDGKEIFPEIMAGDIRSAGFDLNGCWVPLYNWHKLYGGLFDAQTFCGINKGIYVAEKLGAYIDKVFAALNDEQVQKVLDCEFGGLNDSFAELHRRTNNPRWLALANRMHHKRIIDPLMAGEDKLGGNHANTQVPKLLAEATLYEITGKPEHHKATSFFWERVTKHHSYVIGGNADREYFFAPDTISKHITEATCEHCNTYNMLKLTRSLYSWNTDSGYFDYFERAHFNHVLSQQNPKTGMFSYMTPLFTGAERGFSSPFDNWTCCHGTGMESHAKHGESIFWEGGDALFVNLYIPSTAKWASKGAQITLDTRYPYDGASKLTVTSIRRPTRFKLALRVPGWAKSADVSVNGKPAKATRDGGYLVIDRVWAAGDSATLTLPLDLRFEATTDDAKVGAILYGPLVLAGDLGPVETEFKGTEPALVANDLISTIKPVALEKAHFRTEGSGRPGELNLVPFYSQYERRSAVYFKNFDEAQWKVEEAAFLAEQARLKDLAARSVDVMHLGEMQPERDHNLESDVSWPGSYRGRYGRDARQGGFMQFTMKVRPDVPLILQASYWGDDRRQYDILIDGEKLTTVTHATAPKPGEFFDEQYPVPERFTKGKSQVLIRLQPSGGRSTGMVFGMLLFTAK